jgi:hypothetical protein
MKRIALSQKNIAAAAPYTPNVQDNFQFVIDPAVHSWMEEHNWNWSCTIAYDNHGFYIEWPNISDEDFALFVLTWC